MPNEQLKQTITRALSKETGGPSAVATDIAIAIEQYLQPIFSGLIAPGAFGSPMGPCFPAAISAPVAAALGAPPVQPEQTQTSNPQQLKMEIIREVFALLEENYDITLKPGKVRPGR